MEPSRGKIEAGIALLLIDAGALVYLATPGVRRYFERRRSSASTAPVP